MGSGWDFTPIPPLLKSAKAHCPSSAEHPAIIDKYLAKEVSLGRVAGPFQAPALSNLHVSRFGVIPKKDGGWRLILDLSFPFGDNVNDGINKEDFTVPYSKVSDAIALIFKAGRDALMDKVLTLKVLIALSQYIRPIVTYWECFGATVITLI